MRCKVMQIVFRFLGQNILINTHKIIWYDFGGTKVRGYGGTRIDFSRNIGRADYSRTSAPPALPSHPKLLFNDY